MPKIFIALFLTNFLSAQGVKISRISGEINTENSEFNFLQLSSSEAYYSASIFEENYYRTSLYSAEFKNDVWIKHKKVDFGEYFSQANISYLKGDKYMYFSACDQQRVCRIAKKEIRTGETKLLDQRINQESSNTTHPHPTKHNEKKIVYFVSDRKGGFGGMDIWFTIISPEGDYSMPINAGQNINTSFNEITPYYNHNNSSLYFSSDRKNGQGGFDIYSAQGHTNIWSEPNNSKHFNSTSDDLYLTFYNDTSGYFSSNRRDTSCCNDIYFFVSKKNYLDTSEITSFEKKIPINLFFDNDEPKPQKENFTYKESYVAYFTREDDYNRISNDKLVRNFFSDSLQANFNSFVALLDEILEELYRGENIEIYIKGYSSPLFEKEYNINLSKRRINSVVSFIKSYKSKIFEQYLLSSKLEIHVEPLGEAKSQSTTSDDPSNKRKSVYSIEAMLERKVQIFKVLNKTK